MLAPFCPGSPCGMIRHSISDRHGNTRACKAIICCTLCCTYLFSFLHEVLQKWWMWEYYHHSNQNQNQSPWKLTADPDSSAGSGKPETPWRSPRGTASGTCLCPHLSVLNVVQCLAAALSVRWVGGSGINASWDSESWVRWGWEGEVSSKQWCLQNSWQNEDSYQTAGPPRNPLSEG